MSCYLVVSVLCLGLMVRIFFYTLSNNCVSYFVLSLKYRNIYLLYMYVCVYVSYALKSFTCVYLFYGFQYVEKEFIFFFVNSMNQQLMYFMLLQQ